MTFDSIVFDAFIDNLARTETPAGVFNQYAYGPAGNEIRRANLRRYLVQMAQRRPPLLLVGEAAGYRGCRLTGVPFTSEAILLRGSDGLLGAANGYTKTDERERVVGEQSATIVWDLLENARPVPLLWNALPFHPHQDGEPWSNRTPTRAELRLGARFLPALLALFDLETVVAVGNKAERTLRHLQIPVEKVRHPAHGGKRAFTAGVRAILDRYRRQSPR